MGRQRSVLPDSELVSRYQAGETFEALGKKFGVSRFVASHRLFLLGVSKREFKRRDKLPRAEVVALREAGATFREIGEKFNLSASSVGNCFRDWGFTAKTESGSAHHSWKHEGTISYTRAHARVQEMRGNPMLCEACLTRDPAAVFEWANRTGDYGNIWDYDRLCKSCHSYLDRARRAEAKIKSTRVLEIPV